MLSKDVNLRTFFQPENLLVDKHKLFPCLITVFLSFKRFFYCLTFKIMGLHNFCQKKNLTFLGEPPLWTPFKSQYFKIIKIDPA